MNHAQFEFSNESPLSPINVLVYDNESLFRKILVYALDKEPMIKHRGTCSHRARIGRIIAVDRS
jgi:hypothetical protein